MLFRHGSVIDRSIGRREKCEPSRRNPGRVPWSCRRGGERASAEEISSLPWSASSARSIAPGVATTPISSTSPSAIAPAILIEIGEERDQLPTMRSILLRSADAQNCMVAATNAARVYDLVKDFKKALFLRPASLRTMPMPSATRHNEPVSPTWVGNLLIADSAVDEAALNYEQALEMMPDDDPVWRARAVGNLGYCRILQGKVREALSLLQESVAELRSLAARPYLISPLLDLAFALLEADKPGPARPVAEEGLALAEELEDLDARKKRALPPRRSRQPRGRHRHRPPLLRRAATALLPGQAFRFRVPPFGRRTQGSQSEGMTRCR